MYLSLAQPCTKFWVLALGYPNPNPPARAASDVDSSRSGMVVVEENRTNGAGGAYVERVTIPLYPTIAL